LKLSMLWASALAGTMGLNSGSKPQLSKVRLTSRHTS